MTDNRTIAPRMKDIARDLGVSVVTVSKVLRNHEDISAETRERVLKRMKEVNYRPNLAARSLVTGKSYLIGLVVPDLVHPFFSQVAKGVSRALRKKGYSLIISSSEEDPELEAEEIDRMLDRGLDLIIIASTQVGADAFRTLDEHQTPYVLIDRGFPGSQANFVGTDDHLIGTMATEHLLENGCKTIAYIGGEGVRTAMQRCEGYKKTLAGRNLFPGNEYVVRLVHGDNAGEVAGYQAMQKLLNLPKQPDGVFCFNDPSAMGAMQAILDAGLRIPDDIAVIGCGNVLYSSMLRVPLSSIDQESEALGEQAANLALGILSNRGERPPSKSLLMRPTLVARTSSLRRAAG